MYLLVNEEISQVSGAGYCEDITAVAATMSVATSVGGFSKGLMLGLANGFGAASPVGFVFTALAPVMYFAAPAAIASTVFANNPDLLDAVTSKYHSYFG